MDAQKGPVFAGLLAQVLGVGLAAALLLLVLSPLDWRLCLLFAAALAALAWLYFYAVHQTTQKRQADDWQLENVEWVNLWNVSRRTADHISHRLIKGPQDTEDENVVWLLSRQKKLVLVLKTALPLLFAALFFGLSAKFGDVSLNLHHGAPTHASRGKGDKLPDIRPALPKSTGLHVHLRAPRSIPWWVSFDAGLICLLAAWYMSLDWQSRFMMVTNRRFYLFRQPPWYLPMMNEEDHPLPLIRVNEPHVTGSAIAMLLGLARISLDTNMQPDEDALFKNMVGWPHADEIHKIVSQLLPDQGSSSA